MSYYLIAALGMSMTGRWRVRERDGLSPITDLPSSAAGGSYTGLLVLTKIVIVTLEH